MGLKWDKTIDPSRESGGIFTVELYLRVRLACRDGMRHPAGRRSELMHGNRPLRLSTLSRQPALRYIRHVLAKMALKQPSSIFTSASPRPADPGFGEGRHAGVAGGGGLQYGERQGGARGFAEAHSEIE